MSKIQEDRVGACSERVKLAVKARAEEAFGGEESSSRVTNAFCEVVHVACPIVKMLTEAAARTGGFGAGSGGNVCGECEVVVGPAGVCLTSGATVFIPLGQILPVIVMCGIGADGLECEPAFVPPEPCPIGYYVVEEGLEIEIVEVIVREEEVSSFVAEFG